MLYHANLETMICVVETGSFRGAAEVIGISPSAVLKQISLLEQDIGIKIFDRGRKGVTLTPAGRSVYEDARYIVKYSNEAKSRARELAEKKSNIIRIGVSQMAPVDAFTNLWPGIRKLCPDIRIRLNSFGESAFAFEQAFQTLGTNHDLIFCIYDEEFLERYHLSAVRFFDITPVIAYAYGHPLEDISKEKLSLDDLRPYTLLLQKKGFMRVTDEIRELAEAHQIVVEDSDIYNLEDRYQIQEGNKLMAVFNTWKAGRALYQVKPVEWDCRAFYGAIYSEASKDKISDLVEYARRAAEQTD